MGCPITSNCDTALNSFEMAIPLPQVHSVVDCASFNRTVLPFLSQLTTLPAQLQVAASTKDVDSLKDIYLSTNPFISALGFTLVLWVLFAVAAEFNRNYSQVDRFWSILPSVYTVHFVAWARLWGIKNQSLDTIALITLLWGVSILKRGLCICR